MRGQTFTETTTLATICSNIMIITLVFISKVRTVPPAIIAGGRSNRGHAFA